MKPFVYRIQAALFLALAVYREVWGDASDVKVMVMLLAALLFIVAADILDALTPSHQKEEVS